MNLFYKGLELFINLFKNITKERQMPYKKTMKKKKKKKKKKMKKKKKRK